MAALALSLLFYGLTALCMHLAVRAVGGGAPLAQVAAASVVARLPELVPISLGGLGVREGAQTYCLAQLDLSVARAAAAALLLRVAIWFHAAVGGCVFALSRGDRTAPH